MNDLYAPILRNWIFPLAQKLQRRNYSEVRTASRGNQLVDWEVLRKLQLNKLKALLKHANETVPHYQRLFSRMGIKPEDINCLADLEQLPLLTKEQILADPQSFVSSRPRSKPQEFKTSGSSGMPLYFHQDQESITAGLVCRYRALEAWGIKLGDRYLKFHGGGVDSRLFPGISMIFKNHIWEPLEDRIMNRRFASAFAMTTQKLESYWRILQGFKPTYIFGYPAAVELLAQYILDNGYNGRSTGIKLVVCIGEILYEGQRQVFDRAFGCPVVEEYGTAEVGVIAYSYPCGEIHTMDDFLIVEIIKSDPANDFGAVVVTNLENWASPLIRYNLEDLAAPDNNKSGCADGITFARISKILGRQFDMIRLPGGEIVHGMYFDALMRKIPGVTRFQVIQTTNGVFQFTLLLQSEEFYLAVKTEIETRMRRRFGNVKVRVTSVPEISTEASGKFRYVVSEIRD